VIHRRGISGHFNAASVEGVDGRGADGGDVALNALGLVPGPDGVHDDADKQCGKQDKQRQGDRVNVERHS